MSSAIPKGSTVLVTGINGFIALVTNDNVQTELVINH
jgi:hypothetical protein